VTKEKVKEESWWEEEPEESPKESIFTKFKTSLAEIRMSYSRPVIRKPSMWKVKGIIALALLMAYLFITITTVQNVPTILLLTFPTMWILADYIQELSKRKEEEG